MTVRDSVASQPNTASPIRLGIDLGGTKIEIIALDPQGKEKLRNRIATPKDSYESIVQALVQLVSESEKELNQFNCSVGIGIPGAISKKTGLIKNANTTVLIGKALDKDLSTALNRTVKLENDANCFALSEATDGAGQDAKSVFAVILGTGVGGGLVFNNQLIIGPNAIAGEWGHNPLPWPTEHDEPKQLCYCGKKGCIETYLSGPGMAEQSNLQFGLAETSETLLDQPDAFSEVYDLYVDRLARSLATVINVIDPDTIVLGGGLSNVASLYSDVPKQWQKYVFSDEVNTKLVQNVHGDSSGVRGAAWL